jgi:hypothetical protein
MYGGGMREIISAHRIFTICLIKTTVETVTLAAVLVSTAVVETVEVVEIKKGDY